MPTDQEQQKSAAAATATPVPVDASKIDTKLLNKIKPYPGRQRTVWPGWRFAFIAMIGAMSPGMVNRMNKAEVSAKPLKYEDMTAPEQGESSMLAFILSQVLVNGALTILMNSPDGNGYEAWRRLSRRERPSSGACRVAELQAILGFKWSSDFEKLLEEVEALESMVHRYESSSSKTLGDDIHQAVVKNGVPSPLREQVMVQEFDNYAALKDAITAYVDMLGSSSPPAPPADDAAEPMEVDMLSKSKQQWWDTRRQQRDSQKQGGGFKGYCETCCKWGHRSKECKSKNDWSGSSWSSWNWNKGDWGQHASCNLEEEDEDKEGQAHSLEADTGSSADWVF